MMTQALWISTLECAVFGAFLASFASLAAWRLPRHQNLATPGSFCPTCHTRLRFWDLLPIISYLMRRGHCHYCRAVIPRRELFVEILGFVWGGIICHTWGVSPSAAFYGLAGFGFLVIALVDLERHEVPLSIIAGLFIWWALARGYQMEHGWISMSDNPLAGVIVMLLVSGIATMVARGQYGGGDWLIGMLMGLYLGPYMAFVAWFAANFLSIPWVIHRWAAFKARPDQPHRIPFAPGLGFATALLFLPPVQIMWMQLFPYRW
ncbi:MAG: prepilin peptidase [Sulfobacillus sp.]